MLIDTLGECFDGMVKPAFQKSSAGPEEGNSLQKARFSEKYSRCQIENNFFLEKAATFYSSLQESAEEYAKKLEKILKIMKIEDATNSGKIS